MEDPPARNAAWRFGKKKSLFFSSSFSSTINLGFNVPVNYDDVGLNCGGLSIQKINGKYSIDEIQLDLLKTRR